jgi:hypothetical protein
MRTQSKCHCTCVGVLHRLTHIPAQPDSAKYLHTQAASQFPLSYGSTICISALRAAAQGISGHLHRLMCTPLRCMTPSTSTSIGSMGPTCRRPEPHLNSRDCRQTLFPLVCNHDSTSLQCKQSLSAVAPRCAAHQPGEERWRDARIEICAPPRGGKDTPEPCRNLQGAVVLQGHPHSRPVAAGIVVALVDCWVRLMHTAAPGGSPQ